MKTLNYPMGNNLTNLLRWGLVLPAALLSYLIVFATVALLTMVLPSAIFWKEILGNAIGGYAFIWGGTYLAPNHKRVTALILTILLAMGLGAMMTISYFKERPPEDTFYWVVFPGGLATIIAATIACLLINRKAKERETG